MEFRCQVYFVDFQWHSHAQSSGEQNQSWNWCALLPTGTFWHGNCSEIQAYRNKSWNLIPKAQWWWLSYHHIPRIRWFVMENQLFVIGKIGKSSTHGPFSIAKPSPSQQGPPKGRRFWDPIYNGIAMMGLLWVTIKSRSIYIYIIIYIYIYIYLLCLYHLISTGLL